MDEVVLFKWDFANENVMFYCDFLENGRVILDDVF